MFSYEDRLRAVQLYIKLGKRVGLTIRQLGYPTKNALKTWYREFEQRHELSAGYGASPGTPRRTSNEPSSTTLSMAAASRRRSSRWAIHQGLCCPRGFKSCIRRSVRASLVDPRNWRLKPSRLPSSPSACARQARRQWLTMWACPEARCTSGRISCSATKHPHP